MEFTIQCDALLKAVKAATFIVERKNALPINSHLLVSASKRTVSFTGTDLDTDVTATAAAEIEHGGKTCIPAHALLTIAQTITGPASFDGGREQIKVTDGSTDFSLATMPPEEFAGQKAPADGLTTFDTSASEFCAALKTVRHAISSEEARFYLNGVYLHSVGNKHEARIVATDGHRLAARDLGFRLPRAVAGIIPRRTVAAILNAFAEFDGDLAIAVGTEKISVKAGGVTILSRLIDGTYPDYQRVFPPAPDKSLKVDAAALRAGIGKVRAALSNGALGIAVNAASKRTTLSVDGIGFKASCPLVAEFNSRNPLRIGFNHKYLGDAMDALPQGEIVFALTDEGSPAIITSPEAPHTQLVLMPMRI